jgi:hypothetical protein
MDPRFDLPLDRWTPIGGGIEIKPMHGYSVAETVVFGVRHPSDADGALSATPGWCVGSVPIDSRYGSSGHNWQVVQERPLTLSPSIRCAVQGHSMHGFIREGRWEAV